MFADRLAKLRDKKGYTQKELSERLGIARTTYSGYENGTREPDHLTLQKIADFFDVTTDYILGRDQKNNKPQDYGKYLVVKELTEKYGFNPDDPESLEILEDLLKTMSKMKKS